jgi:hypothetical protein
LHLALIRFIISGCDDTDPIVDILGTKERRHFFWQESVAQFLVWLNAEDPAVSLAIRALRSQEYHQISSEARLLVLQVISGKAFEQDAIRSAVDRRAEWKLAQGWDWDAAVALGRVQHSMESYQLVRMEPLGRDRHGSLYIWFESAVWVLSETGYRCLREATSVRKLLQSLQGGAQLQERLLHLALTNLLKDGALRHSKASGELELLTPTLSRPKYEKVLGCAINCTISDRNVRLFVLDLPRHVQVKV